MDSLKPGAGSRAPTAAKGESARRELQEIVELSNHSLHVRLRKAVPLFQALAERGNFRIDELWHAAPPGEGRRPQRGGAHRLDLREKWKRDLEAGLLIERPQLGAADALLIGGLEQLLEHPERCHVGSVEGSRVQLREPCAPLIFSNLPRARRGEGVVSEAIVGHVGHAVERCGERKRLDERGHVLIGQRGDGGWLTGLDRRAGDRRRRRTGGEQQRR